MLRTAAQPLTQSLLGAARGSARRGYATSPPAGGSNKLNTFGLTAGVAGLAGLGYLAFFGGGDQKAAEAAQKAKNVAQGATGIAGALDKNKFTEFKLKEIKPYNHDSAM